jgi:hypothetical protein
VRVIVRKVITPGQEPDPIRITRVGGDEEWICQPGEATEAFEARVAAYVKGPGRIATLVVHSREAYIPHIVRRYNS